MSEFSIKQNDTQPAIEAQLLDEDYQPRDLTAVDEVRFHMENPDSDGGVVVDSVAEILDAEEGRVMYEWGDEDTSEAGRFDAEFEVAYSNDDGVETWPNRDDISVYITEEIA